MESQGIPQLARHTFITDGGMETTLLCAHPTHLAGALDDDGPWLERVRGLRANASARSHADLDAADELDEGDPDDLARRYLELSRKLPNLTVLGGCCGIDHRNVGAICAAWSASDATSLDAS